MGLQAQPQLRGVDIAAHLQRTMCDTCAALQVQLCGDSAAAAPAEASPYARQGLALQSQLCRVAIAAPLQRAISYWIFTCTDAALRGSSLQASVSMDKTLHLQGKRGLWLHCSLPTLHSLSSCRRLPGAV